MHKLLHEYEMLILSERLMARLPYDIQKHIRNERREAEKAESNEVRPRTSQEGLEGELGLLVL
jgi:hypothetical protein